MLSFIGLFVLSQAPIYPMMVIELPHGIIRQEMGSWDCLLWYWCSDEDPDALVGENSFLLPYPN